MHNIKNHIYRIKEQLDDYQPYMEELNFSFFTSGSGNDITVKCKDDPEFFAHTFGMEDKGTYLTLSNNIDTEDDYWSLYNNALVIMLEQCLNDPRPITLDFIGAFIYKHSPTKDDDELDCIRFDNGMIETEYVSDSSNVEGTMDEYIDMVKKLWNGTNSAYNLYLYDQVLSFDTHPAY